MSVALAVVGARENNEWALFTVNLLWIAGAVVAGEAEGVWEKLLEDIERGQLRKIYHEPNPDLDRYVPKDFTGLPKKRLLNLVPLNTTRGCPHNCEFCCVSHVYGKKIKHIPVENVVRDIKTSKFRNYIFLDDNIMAYKEYARELFEALIPLKIHWVGQSSISFAQDEEMIRLARKSGCRGLFIGLESVEGIRDGRFPKLNSLEETRKNIRRILKAGIIIQASVILGFDEDTQDTFGETVRFLVDNRVSLAGIHVLTPYPGTRVYEELKVSGRLLHENWEHYDHHTVVFRPKNMTPQELQIGNNRAKAAFNSWGSIGRRLFGNMRMPGVYLMGNMGYRKHALTEKVRMLEFEERMDNY